MGRGRVTMAQAKPWLTGLAILLVFALAVALVLAAFDVFWGMHELDQASRHAGMD
jgi:hypothetical protein